MSVCRSSPTFYRSPSRPFAALRASFDPAGFPPFDFGPRLYPFGIGPYPKPRDSLGSISAPPKDIEAAASAAIASKFLCFNISFFRLFASVEQVAASDRLRLPLSNGVGRHEESANLYRRRGITMVRQNLRRVRSGCALPGCERMALSFRAAFHRSTGVDCRVGVPDGRSERAGTGVGVSCCGIAGNCALRMASYAQVANGQLAVVSLMLSNRSAHTDTQPQVAASRRLLCVGGLQR